MSTKYDINSLYFDEANKYFELATKVGRTTTGNTSYTSTTSGITYNSTTGEEGLCNAIQTGLSDYMITATDWNNVYIISQNTAKRIRWGCIPR